MPVPSLKGGTSTAQSIEREGSSATRQGGGPAPCHQGRADRPSIDSRLAYAAAPHQTPPPSREKVENVVYPPQHPGGQAESPQLAGVSLPREGPREETHDARAGHIDRQRRHGEACAESPHDEEVHTMAERPAEPCAH